MAHESRHIEKPTEGTYATRLVKGGPRVPVRLVLEAKRWRAIVNGEPQPQSYTDEEVEALVFFCVLNGSLAKHPFVKLLAFAKAIDESDYERMIARLAWAKENAPDDPCMHPGTAINLTRLPSLW